MTKRFLPAIPGCCRFIFLPLMNADFHRLFDEKEPFLNNIQLIRGLSLICNSLLQSAGEWHYTGRFWSLILILFLTANWRLFKKFCVFSPLVYLRYAKNKNSLKTWINWLFLAKSLLKLAAGFILRKWSAFSHLPHSSPQKTRCEKTLFWLPYLPFQKSNFSLNWAIGFWRLAFDDWL